MRKLLFIVMGMMASCVMLFAQRSDQRRPYYVSLQGGALFSVSENYFTYREAGQFGGLFTPQGAVAVGYDLSHRIGLRMQVAFGNNASACNKMQTAARGFYPYQFKSVNGFVDASLNLGNRDRVFQPKLYLGLGLAYTFDFTESGHPWQKVSPTNLSAGFRGGFLAQFDIWDRVSLFADLCGEGYLDNYNGLQPTEEDQAAVEGYAGFPLDLRASASLGVMFRF